MNSETTSVIALAITNTFLPLAADYSSSAAP
jgi:hypothetical protein